MFSIVKIVAIVNIMVNMAYNSQVVSVIVSTKLWVSGLRVSEFLGLWKWLLGQELKVSGLKGYYLVGKEVN